MKYGLFLAVTAAILIGAPASAQDTRPAASGDTAPAPPPSTTVVVKAKKNSDPNRTVCRSNIAIGSRLRTTRNCQTIAMWERQRAEDRQAVEVLQALRWKN